MVGRTLFAIAQDESRPILTGCLMEINASEMRVVALDGYRLAPQGERRRTGWTISAVVGGRVLGDIAKIWRIRRTRLPCASPRATCA